MHGTLVFGEMYINTLELSKASCPCRSSGTGRKLNGRRGRRRGCPGISTLEFRHLRRDETCPVTPDHFGLHAGLQKKRKKKKGLKKIKAKYSRRKRVHQYSRRHETAEDGFQGRRSDLCRAGHVISGSLMLLSRLRSRRVDKVAWLRCVVFAGAAELTARLIGMHNLREISSEVRPLVIIVLKK